MHDGNLKRKKIAVMFGGRSVEHEISIITALQLIEAMDTVRYEPVPVYIAASGKWYSGSALLKREFYREMPASLSSVQEVVLLPVPGMNGLTILPGKAKQSSSFFGGLVKFEGKEKRQDDRSEELIPIDIFFPVFHGSYGEDGCMQGLFELAEVPYTGSDLVSSAISMSKYHCKKFIESHEIPVLPSVLLSREGLDDNLGSKLIDLREQVISTPGFDKFPLFVKPSNLGSSIAVSKASDTAGLDAALLQAFKYDTHVLVEPCLENKLEINVSVRDAAQAEASVVEVPVASGDQLSYEDKYMREGGGKKNGRAALGMAGLTRVIDPEDLDPSIKTLARDYARKAFAALGCAGVARLDFMLDLTTGTLYFNEINPLPGSLAYYLWVKSAPAVLFTDLISQCIERAEKRYTGKKALGRDIGFKALFK